MMTKRIELEGLVFELTHKKVKNLRVSIRPPDGALRVSAPLRMPFKTILAFLHSKLAWIQQHQQEMQEKSRASLPEYRQDEVHYLWGKPCALTVSEHHKAALVELSHQGCLHLKTRPEASYEKKQGAMDSFYRLQLQQILPPLIEKWEKIIEVKVEGFSVQKMKTRWGVCRPSKKHIKLNTELVKKPIEYLEYVVVHEIIHLLEPSHNHRFKALMDHFMPSWRLYRKELNNIS